MTTDNEAEDYASKLNAIKDGMRTWACDDYGNVPHEWQGVMRLTELLGVALERIDALEREVRSLAARVRDEPKPGQLLFYSHSSNRGPYTAADGQVVAVYGTWCDMTDAIKDAHKRGVIEMWPGEIGEIR